MPMKWTSDKDQLMLVTLLKTHQISINYNAIAEAWPDNEGEKPTARAISERLIKIRKNVNNSSSSFSSGAVKLPRSVNSTPSKPRAQRAAPGTGTPTSKRRRIANDDGDDDERTIGQKELRDLGVMDPRSSPTPQQPPVANGTPGVRARTSTVGSSVMPTRESTLPHSISNGNGNGIGYGNANGNGNGNASGSSSSTAPSSRPSQQPQQALHGQPAPAVRGNTFAARTPLSMEPTAAGAGAGAGAGAAAAPAGGMSMTPNSVRASTVRSTPRRAASMATIKLEETEDDDDALQGVEDDSDTSDWGANFEV